MSLMIPKQCLCRGLHLGQVIRLLRRQIGLQREVRHPDDGVHRSADFMAHVGQEIRLGLGGSFGCFLGHRQVCSLNLGLGKQLLGLQLARQDLRIQRHSRQQ